MFKKKQLPEWSRSGSFLRKPAMGWLHSDETITSSGVCYAVKYIGCLKILQSMRTLPYETRLLVTREAMHRCCEARGMRFAKRKKPPKNISKILAEYPQATPLDNQVSLTISSAALKMIGMKTGQIIANHDMQGISFTSGGEKDASNLVGYVAKDDVNGRACHVLDCGENLAFDVITTIGQAFELRYKQFLHNPPQALHTPERFVESIFESPEDEEAIFESNEPNNDDYEAPRQEGPGHQKSEYQVPKPVHSTPNTPSYPDYQVPKNHLYGVLEASDEAFDRFNGKLIDLSGPEFAAGAVYDNPNTGSMAVFNNPLSSPTSQGQISQNLLYDNRDLTAGQNKTGSLISENVLYDSADGNKKAEVTINSVYDNPQRLVDPGKLNWMRFDDNSTNGPQNMGSRPLQPPPPAQPASPEYASVEEPEYAEPCRRPIIPAPEPKEGQMKKPPPKPVPYAASKGVPDQQDSLNMGGLKNALPPFSEERPSSDITANVWFHGAISRTEADLLLEDEGDFLVRESKSQPGQYVLSGMQGGQVRHLLLVDPQGKVRTKDKVFKNVPELISYHINNDIPIVSAGSSVKLVNPVITQ